MDDRMITLIGQLEAEGVELAPLLSALSAIERGASGHEAFLVYEAAAAPPLLDALLHDALIDLARQHERILGVN